MDLAKLFRTLKPQLLILTVIGSMLPNLVSGADRDVIRVGMMDFPPYYSLSKDNLVEGELVDLLNRVMIEMDQRWTPQFFEVPHLLTNLTEGKTDLAMLIRHPLLEQKALYGKRPVGRLILKAYRRDSNPAAQSLESLRGKRLILLRGYGYGGLVNKLIDAKNGRSPLFASNRKQALQWLQAEKGDYLLDYQGPASTALKNLGYSKITGDTVLDKNIYFVLSGRLANAPSIMARLERALSRVSLKNK
ncbi:MAG: transporter substrate-binding domain-containing protein [Motiliproteus sp.]|nr:transporter substrate-binding domain-containing protein [Motiliproteus sp.]MCW9052557.1 transporter substrate-binding domain-containing protein [Motiliproteus sp.]